LVTQSATAFAGKFIKRAEKIFPRSAFKLIASGQNAGFCRKKTENVTGKVTLSVAVSNERLQKSGSYFVVIVPLKCGKTRSFLTESTFRGEALKDRSEGGWRSGRRRSGDVGGGGTVNVFRVFRVVPVLH
jgi:hypothetical protein